MMARPLTARQQQVYDFIQERIATRGYGPTVREIGEFLGIKSPNGVMCHLRALERKGMISRLANKSRAIEITRRPDGSALVESPMPLDAGLVVRGCIAKGECNLYEAPEAFDLLEALQRTERYLLAYNGDELRDYAIDDGDMLVIEPCRQGNGTGLELVQSAAGAIELKSPTDQDASDAAAEVVGVVVGVLRMHTPEANVRAPHHLERKIHRARSGSC